MLTRSFGLPLLSPEDALLPAIADELPSMAVDVREEKDKFIVKADVPGVDKGAVRVSELELNNLNFDTGFFFFCTSCQ